MRPGPTTALALAAIALTAPARAGSFDIFGGSARDIGMGGAMTAAVIGPTALYYNPAALTLDKQHTLSAGLTLSVPALYVDRARPDAEPGTTLPEVHTGISLGWTKPFGGIFDDRVAIGVSISLPVERLARVQGVDPASPQFYLYQNLQDKLLIHLGIAGDPLEWLSIGAGLQVLADLSGRATLEMDILAGVFDRRAVDVTLMPTLSPYFGVHIRPPLGPGGGQLKLGAAFRGSSAIAFELPVVVSEGEALGLVIDVEQQVLWTPKQIAFGLSYGLDEPALTFALDATWAMWSDAPDPSPRLSVDVSGRLVDALGLSDALDLSARTGPIDMGFVDTLTVRGGVEWSPTGPLTLRAGYAFRPTPAPRQSGPTAYLDNDAHLVALGVGFSFRNPLQKRLSVVDLDLSIQATLLPRRTAYRSDPGNPGGDLSHGGALWHFALGVGHHF
ncbi:MAG: outer membrane protein transport protein [Deltaproteobacteria bacterium]|nr:outer membrane protein transport protein [Deltaproteobacteria bacterium]